MTLKKRVEFITLLSVMLACSVALRIALAAAGPSCEVLIAAKNLNHSLKGFPKHARNTPVVWGRKDCPPSYVILRITDADASQVNHFFAQWYKTFSYEILNENDQGYRIRVTVDPACVSVSGTNREIRTAMKTYIVDTYGAVLFSHDGHEAVVDIPKPLEQHGVAVTIPAMKADIHDKFSEYVAHRRFRFTSADVDYALAQPGGIIERTKSQVLAMIKDMLDE